jgi:hypothetical protein
LFRPLKVFSTKKPDAQYQGLRKTAEPTGRQRWHDFRDGNVTNPFPFELILLLFDKWKLISTDFSFHVITTIWL